uniref:Genome polyprotein n=1 Tax=Salt wort potyvirus TaxID=2933187 RepID=A0A9C7GWN2_9POTV|nr:polyprotein [Salt wort potyvirus]CAI5383977.1 polyprotein [Salt wort potyvirus]
MTMYASTIFFGAFECKISTCGSAGTGRRVDNKLSLRDQKYPCALPQSTSAGEYRSIAQAIIASRHNPLPKIDNKYEHDAGKFSLTTVVRDKNGSAWLKHPSRKQLAFYKRKMELEAEEERTFQNAPPYIVWNLSIAGGEVPSFREEEDVKKWPLHKTPRMRTCKTFKNPKLSDQQFNCFIRQLKNIMAEKEGTIHLVDKKITQINYRAIQKSSRAFVVTRHMRGVNKPVDFFCSNWTTKIMSQLVRVTSWSNHVRCKDLSYGDSGGVLNSKKLIGQHGRSWNGMFIVRGSYDGKLFDARSKVSKSVMNKMMQFSHADQFWKGFDSNWNRFKTHTAHTCKSEISVPDCGKAAAILVQCITPCEKITCKLCAHEYDTLPESDLMLLLNVHAERGLEELKKENMSDKFPHIVRFLKTMLHMTESVNDFSDDFNEIFKMIGDKKHAPFDDLNVLNNFFLKGKGCNQSDWEKAQESFFKLVKFQKNRTDNIKKGDISSFRNKLSAKANWNVHLTCDNQRGKNANFLWGQREYHAKRFFSNFFKLIDPKDGYASHELRLTPNGSRKLAINNLLVPLNLYEFREKMKGEYLQQPHTSKKCVGMKNGNFVYPTCCTTWEDGSAIESVFYPPTKKHLVIGNSGDQKYVDMPKGETEMLYMAKDGYCYINIYLAMLINVNEEDAKDFTKKVRDMCISSLGKWPTLMDVATTCAQLKIFFPDVNDAELPRILVDHETQTCHVIDSYGSTTTGYHVLKAATVAQLILFASNELESDIKHYQVGGTPARYSEFSYGYRFTTKLTVEEEESGLIRTLVKGIFRPRLMERLLIDEPYIMLMSLLSPGILIAMYNNGAFEQAVKLWINEKQSIALIATMLSALAQKVSVADTLLAQYRTMEASAANLCDVTSEGFQMFLSYNTAVGLLLKMRDKAECDSQLLKNGFLSGEKEVVELREKSYLNLLNEAWYDLTWREKLSAIWHSQKLKKSIVKPLSFIGNADMKGLYDISLGAYFAKSANHIKRGCQFVSGQTRNFVNARIINFSTFFIRQMCHRLPDFSKFLNSVVIISSLTTSVAMCQSIILQQRCMKAQITSQEEEKNEQACLELYEALKRKGDGDFTMDEYLNYVQSINPYLAVFAKERLSCEKEVHHQRSTIQAKYLEQIVAFIALVVMTFDAERSDCVFKTLNKLKGLVSTMDSDVRHQSLDDIMEDLETRNTMIDVELNDEILQKRHEGEIQFSQWLQRQIQQGFTIPHYRTEGEFMEFTRATAAKVANDISRSSNTDFLIRGAVGSGKSTGLPANLSMTGRVLLIEPTRPLAENVFRQLSHAPFHKKPTLRMRGNSVFGSSPISIMTSGFALHYFAHNQAQLQDFTFIIFDECHVLDASAMAFRSLISMCHQSCKLLKVSATPPGRECEFETQHPVKLIVEDSLSFSAFVEAQGTKRNSDVVQHGCNILVYVASYNEVDSLSKLLTDRCFSVTKVDGRTMKHGDLEIETHGTHAKPHFVVATNIIENGVTLDIDVVVDFGQKVSPFLDVDSRSILYNKVNVSYGERIQRLGRVGRFKPGHALRIGFTERGLIEIPSLIATEAALYCFAYNLPVMSSNVSSSIVGNCTARQVKTMHQFELNPFFTCNFVFYDGTMHPVIHEILKKYKLRDSVVPLCEQSVPYRASSAWLTAWEYERLGVRLDLPANTKISFHTKDIPPLLHDKLWETVEKFKQVSLFPSMRSSSVSKIAYTLSTDIYSIPRTLMLIEKLLEDEQTKQYQFQSFIDSGCSSMFSVLGISNALRSRYASNYTGENIRKLEAARNQIKEFANVSVSGDERHLIKKFDALQFVHHQSKHELSKGLRLKGIWNKSLAVRDILVSSCVAVGGAVMIYKWFTNSITDVQHQGLAKHKRIQALKFRRNRDKRSSFLELDNNQDTIEEHFGSAYTKKGKSKGQTKGLGKSSRRFVNMYGFEPGEYSYIRFVDPLTGAVLEENIHADVYDIQEQLGEIRQQKIDADELDSADASQSTLVHAYFIKDWSKKALKVDLTPHNPLRIGKSSNNIAKFPERQFELRQTGPGVEVDLDTIPKPEVEHEAKSFMKGLRDYNPIAQTICKLKASSELGSTEMYGIGFGAYIISNHHLFKSFNGSLEVRSHHGTFIVRNMMSLQVRPIEGRDIIIIRMPKDFPVFPQRLHFRQPKSTDRICIVGSNFQEKSISSTITETSPTYPVQRSTFWKHWIATDDGHCGLPVVSTIDGRLLGIHSLANNANSENYYAAFDDDFECNYLRNEKHVEWVRDWKYNPDNVLWGPLKLKQSTPTGLFKTTKIIKDLEDHISVREQSSMNMWMYSALQDNLQAVAYMQNQLVTKHVVKGECMHFQQYLTSHDQAAAFFTPLLNAYGKSRLNREAYVKDIMKYADPIEVGRVDCDAFEEALSRVILYMQLKGFRQCSYITDEQEIFRALNMKAAVGAMYGGKKKDYFMDFSDTDKEEILRQSCFRLYKGDIGVWNGSIKAELRCREKLDANKTRTFTAAPLDTLLAGKTCVDDFNNQFYAFNTYCCWTVGMTKFYGGWDRLLRSLPEGWIYCDADGSRFDSSLTPYLINAVLSIRLAYMEDWDLGFKMLQNLYTEIIYTPISTPDGTIVKKFRGNNSGQPSTVVDNSLMVVLAMNYALVKEGILFEEAEKCCKFFVNGDDLIVAVNPTHEHLLDVLASHFSDLGLNYDFSSRTTNKTNLWFMSHKGIEREGLYIPKLEEERIVSILQWDRAELPEHRLEAVCAAMIESWGYPYLTHQIRLFYQWLLDQQPFSELAREGKAPYIAEMALRNLYLNRTVDDHELEAFSRYFVELDDDFECDNYEVYHQSGEKIDAGVTKQKEDKGKQVAMSGEKAIAEKDVNAGTTGTFTVPRIKSMTSKMRIPKAKGVNALNLDHLLTYTPHQVDLSNTRATQQQFDNWYEAVKTAYDVSDSEMQVILNGLMIWCIENGTSPNINGVWIMMDGNEQVEYSLKPIVENAKPTLRQIMAHFSDVAEAYIEMRNMKEPYMPRYGLIRNLRDPNLARYAFDFYEMTSRTPVRAREAHIQMKAAALGSSQSRMFGLDGGSGALEENTERHTTEDVSTKAHTLLGMRYN